MRQWIYFLKVSFPWSKTYDTITPLPGQGITYTLSDRVPLIVRLKLAPKDLLKVLKFVGKQFNYTGLWKLNLYRKLQEIWRKDQAGSRSNDRPPDCSTDCDSKGTFRSQSVRR